MLALLCCLLLGWHAGPRWKPGSDGLLLLSAAGVSVLSMSTDLVGVLAGFVGTLAPIWGLAAISAGEHGREAALKGLVLGALGAALLGMGAALVLAGTGTTSLGELRQVLQNLAPQSVPRVVLAGLALVLAGLGVFVAAVPFHMWYADMVEGSPEPAALLLTGAVLASGLAAVCRVLLAGFGPLVREWPGVGPLDWVSVLHAVGLAALLVGNAMALVQSRLKRMAAFLATGQAGLVLVTLAAAGTTARAGGELDQVMGGVLVFLAVHTVNWVGLFVAFSAIGGPQEQEPRVRHLEGLARRHPWLAVALGLALLCMSGMPLTAGFFSRLYLLEAMVNAGWTVTAVVVALSLGLVLVMTLGLVSAMVMRAPGEDVQVRTSATLTVVALVASLTILALGVLPGGVLSVAIQSAGSLLGGG
jgi:NADH-quinone oxidoreductase subunit N